MNFLEVRGAPNYYACESGILKQLNTLMNKHSFKHVFVVTGEKSWNAIETMFPAGVEISYSLFRYNGECSLTEIERLASLCKNYDVVIGIGGGKVLDLAKAVANRVDLNAVLIPTLPSTCAAWTPLSVIYDKNGSFVRFDIFNRSPYMVLVDPQVLLHSPVAYLRAGIADTLAKWYEADAIIRHVKNPPLPVTIAHQTACLCKTTLLEHGFDAIDSLIQKSYTYSFRKVIETIIAAGGMVGGFGERYGRVAGAHSVHNGLTKVSSTHHLLHGEKVAYGILIQLVLEENWEEIQSLLPFYQKLQLPFRLKHLRLESRDEETLRFIAREIIRPDETIHLMNIQINEEVVLQAFYQLEDFRL